MPGNERILLDGQVLQGPRSPEPVDVAPPRRWDDRLADVLPASSRLLSLYADATWAEGPAWWPAGNALVFSDVIGRRTLARREDGSIATVGDRSDFANGNAFDARGRLVQAEHGRRGVSRTDADGTRLLVDAYEGEPLNSPNDLVVASDGAIWFTDPTYGISDPREGYPAQPALAHQSVYRWRDDTGLERMIDLDQPNGLAFSRDERTLYVSESNATALPRVVACSWNGETLGAPRTFATVDAGIPDGFAVDSRDWLWISSEAGVVIVDENGRRLGVIPTPHVVSNCTFDADEKRLFLTGDSDLWMVELA
ncbi:gluconolactonase [Microbacterium sp. ru370.1]|uniref:SMP-30/gluconolactonase/LRE family protein n=1 Tax=unclassified Microbacterium TaxID=2609290 RepID=UPI0008805F7C|nr:MULTISPECIES: SMP-30/gluconolactonase/LRE family protein [unclassified Microbacterium]SDO83008.1 gluconolactonase [Microbacterium sp. ru370.1]SIT90077.1 gluconolactonase [Microbacterium sp. RU1D]